MGDQKKIGAFIAQARERQGISGEALARRLNVDAAEIAAWEDGSAYPALAQAPALARELSVSLDELFNARYHTVAEEYQAPEELFLPDGPIPGAEDAPEAECPAETGQQVGPMPAIEERPLRSKVPVLIKLLFGLCLVVEGAAGIVWLLSNHAGAAFSLVAAAAVAACLTAYFCRKLPHMRRQIILLPVPGVVILLLAVLLYFWR